MLLCLVCFETRLVTQWVSLKWTVKVLVSHKNRLTNHGVQLPTMVDQMDASNNDRCDSK